MAWSEMTDQSSKLVLVEAIECGLPSKQKDKLCEQHKASEILELTKEHFPTREDIFEDVFLGMGWSAMDDVTLAEKYGCPTDEVLDALWIDLASRHQLKNGSVAAVVFPLDLGWVPDDMAELFMSHLPNAVALQHIFPVIRGKILQPGSEQYNGKYRMFPDCPETTLEI